MALRRFAQENSATGSPRSPASHGADSPRNGIPPRTPRNRPSIGMYRSPADTPSISSSVPFDWEAARTRTQAPYSTPVKSRKSVGTGTMTTPRKAVIRKKGFFERVKAVPSNIAFEIALFPHNVPLPTPKSSARIIGGAIHVLYMLIRAKHDSEAAWDNLSSSRETSWFDWTTPITLLLVVSALLNAYNMFTRTRTYRFHRKPDPLASPHAQFVATTLDLEPLPQPTFKQRMLSSTWYNLSFCWRFLFGLQPPERESHPLGKISKVQELRAWDPSEFELELFSIYSPAHALLWLIMKYGNFLLTLIVMALVGAQMNVLIRSYTLLLKDRQLLSAETMKEYNDVFVNPRINPIRKDVAVMTHQSEMVNVWEE